jgi:regulatory protein
VVTKKQTPGQALAKAKHYCAYQERCHSEIKEKLYSYGLDKNDADEIICRLIAENYLNEERFAIHFAGGKFRIKKWGRIKIKYELKKKQVGDYCIKKALDAIDEEAYYAVMEKHIEEKLKSLTNEKAGFLKEGKVIHYLLQKGFERDLVMQALNKT